MEPDVYRRMAEIQQKHWWYEGRRRILASVIARLKLPSNAAILEVGCGTGANLQMLGTFGRVSAMEPDDFARDYAARLSGRPVEKGFLPHELPYKETFDLICAFDVIEHVEEDRESLKALYALTKPGGYGVFTVPAYRFLWSRHDEVNHHKRRYARPQFEELMREAGYKVEFISYYNSLLLPLVVAVRFVKKLLKIKDSPDEAMPKLPLVNDVLREVFAAERWLLNYVRLPAGVSIVAVGKRDT